MLAKPQSTSIALVLLMAALTFCATTAVAQQTEQYKGRLLVDALRALQLKGLRIVFSSATVPSDLRVSIEPRAKTARQQLEQLLAPHGLKARNGPGGTIQIVRAELALKTPGEPAFGAIEGLVVDALTAIRLGGVVVRIDGEKRDTRTDSSGQFRLRRVSVGSRSVRASANGYTSEAQIVQVAGGGTASITLSLTPAAHVLNEYVSVSRSAPYRKDEGVASETGLDRGQWEQLHGSLADNPVRAVHALPRVMSVDDFRSEFSVRGSPLRHVDLVVDGVSTHWLQHTAHRRGATGSLPMLPGYALDGATLRAGAYPRRHSDRLGPQLELALREGSRSGFTLRGAVGGLNATILGEGPLGGTGRGSWLVTARRSYVEWPTDEMEGMRTTFGFSDGLAKLVYDVRSGQQLMITVLGGVSNIDVEEELATNDLDNGRNRAGVLNLSWRSAFGPGVVLRQRAYMVKQDFRNTLLSGSIDRGVNAETGYRADVSRPIAHGVLEGGVHVARRVIRDALALETQPIHGSSWQRSGYAHFAWSAVPTLTLSSGARVSTSSLASRPAISHWLLGEWLFTRNWTLTGSAGASRQLPELRHVMGETGTAHLKPERAKYFDVAIEQRLPSSIRWQATIFSRKEHDIFREPDINPRLAGEFLVFPGRETYVNALQGTSRGIELLVDRQSSTGFAGWASYAYGKTRYTDLARGETYWGDFDQRHAVNLFAMYRFSTRTTAGATFRAGSNFPIPAYLAVRDGRFFVSDTRSQVRLRPYARLDLRADHALDYFGHRLTLFVELLNALNRANLGLAHGSVNMTTGEAFGFTDKLLRRRVLAGILVEF